MKPVSDCAKKLVTIEEPYPSILMWMRQTPYERSILINIDLSQTWVIQVALEKSCLNPVKGFVLSIAVGCHP